MIVNIDEYNRDYETFKKHYNELNAFKAAINEEIAALAMEEQSTSTLTKLLKLRESFEQAIRFCGENMYKDILIIGNNLKHMEKDLKS